MVSALVMQLIQSCTTLPTNASEDQTDENPGSSYDAALICAKTFLASFMKRCSAKVNEDDYRPILENFTDDILTTLNMPEWPAATVSYLLTCTKLLLTCKILLQILNSNLVSNIAKKGDPSNVLRMLSIELLGTIAARLRVEMNSIDEGSLLPTNVVCSLCLKNLNWLPLVDRRSWRRRGRCKMYLQQRRFWFLHVRLRRLPQMVSRRVCGHWSLKPSKSILGLNIVHQNLFERNRYGIATHVI